MVEVSEEVRNAKGVEILLRDEAKNILSLEETAIQVYKGQQLPFRFNPTKLTAKCNYPKD